MLFNPAPHLRLQRLISFAPGTYTMGQQYTFYAYASTRLGMSVASAGVQFQTPMR